MLTYLFLTQNWLTLTLIYWAHSDHINNTQAMKNRGGIQKKSSKRRENLEVEWGRKIQTGR